MPNFFGKLGTKVGTICQIWQTGFRQTVPYSGVYTRFAETQFAESHIEESEGQFANFFVGKLGKVGTICRFRQPGFRQTVPFLFSGTLFR